MKKTTTTTATLLILLLTAQANAARVGLVVQFPDASTIQKAITISENATGYQVANAAGLSLQWGSHPQFGHSLCRINGIGTPPGPSGCEWTGDSWAYWIIKAGESSWTSMPVGHDGGTSCWNRNPLSWDGHYCATDGDIVGYVFGSYDPVTWQPPRITVTPRFSDIFGGESGGKSKALDYYISFNVEGRSENTTVIRVYDRDTNRSLREARVEVFSGDPGVTQKILESEAGWDGTANLTLKEPSEYGLRITAARHHQLYTTIKVDEPTTTTQATTSTTTTTATTTSTTAATLTHFLLEASSTTETTSTTESTATSESTSTSATESTTSTTEPTTPAATTETPASTTQEEPAVIGNMAGVGAADTNGGRFLPYAVALVIILLPLAAWLRS